MSATAIETPPEISIETSVETSTSPAGDDGWRRDRQGRQYTAARGRSGVVYRKGDETIQEAHARDAKGPRDKRPKPKAKSRPPAPSRPSDQELEFQLAEALRSPAMLCAMHGDEWAANHFVREGPELARNLVHASAHNPWLRAKLELAVAGEGLLPKLLMSLGLATAIASYALPPLLYYVPVPFIGEEAREMFGVPDRKIDHAQAPEAPAPAASESAPATAAAAAA